MATEYICSDCLFDDKRWDDNQSQSGPGICARCGKMGEVKGFRKITFADIEVPKPKPRPPVTDWDELKAEFIAQKEYKQVRPWLRDIKGWEETKVESGHTQKMIIDWSRERAEERQTILEQAKQDAKDKLTDMIPDLYLAKHKILEKLTAKLDNSLDIDEFIDILKTIKTELGEPTSVSKQQITASEEVDEAIQELRDVVNSSRKGADNGGSAGESSTPTTEPDPIQVS